MIVCLLRTVICFPVQGKFVFCSDLQGDESTLKTSPSSMSHTVYQHDSYSSAIHLLSTS